MNAASIAAADSGYIGGIRAMWAAVDDYSYKEVELYAGGRRRGRERKREKV